jgi:hypothetical protein
MIQVLSTKHAHLKKITRWRIYTELTTQDSSASASNFFFIVGLNFIVGLKAQKRFALANELGWRTLDRSTSALTIQAT